MTSLLPGLPFIPARQSHGGKTRSLPPFSHVPVIPAPQVANTTCRPLCLELSGSLVKEELEGKQMTDYPRKEENRGP